MARRSSRPRGRGVSQNSASAPQGPRRGGPLLEGTSTTRAPRRRSSSTFFLSRLRTVMRSHGVEEPRRERAADVGRGRVDDDGHGSPPGVPCCLFAQLFPTSSLSSLNHQSTIIPPVRSATVPLIPLALSEARKTGGISAFFVYR